ncbi:MAG: hypothetical protein IT171_02380 [Acidobacteria bacterium]|nr:hypothetical protein [Acidobacteriota bacterium]
MINASLFEYRRSLRPRVDDILRLASETGSTGAGASLKKLIENENDLRRFTDEELGLLSTLEPIVSTGERRDDLTAFTPEPSEIDAIIDSLT